MKAYTLLILFAFFQILSCKIEGITINKLHDAYVKSVPYMKAFHEGAFDIPSNPKFLNVKLELVELNKNNTNFTIDEFDILHIKFVNLKAKITGQYQTKLVWRKREFQTFKANLTDISFEQSYTIATTKQANGTYALKYKTIGSDALSLKVKNFDFIYYGDKDKAMAVKTASAALKNLNYKVLKLYLIKLQKLVLDTVKADLLKK